VGIVLVTGASGFVGQRVLAELETQGESVRALVRDPAKAERMRARGVEVHVGDLRDHAVLDGAVRDVDVVLHCAAAVGNRYGAREFQEVNVAGTRQLLEAANAARCRRVVLLSSLHVLGIGNLDPCAEDLPCRRTRDAAANAKIEMERLALDWSRKGPPSVVILRPGVIYGPGDSHNIPKLLEALRRGKFVFLVSRDNLVPVVHVDDVARAMLLAAHAPEGGSRIFHITDGSRTTIGEFVERLAELAQCAPPKRVIRGAVLWPLLGLLNGVRRVFPRCPDPVPPGPLRFLATSRFVDIQRARDELGYVPRIQYRAGLATALATKSPGSRTEGGMSGILDDTQLHDRVVRAIRAHWTEPAHGPARFAVPRNRIDELARAALAAMLTRPFRVGPLPSSEVHAKLLARVRRRVALGKPISISLGFGGLKNPNSAPPSRADWAEFFALSHLIKWHNRVQSVYPPGLTIRMVFDDMTHRWANRGDGGCVASYTASMLELVRILGFDRVIERFAHLSTLTWICLARYPLANRHVRRWERDPRNRGQMERMADAARRNLPPGPELCESRQDFAVEQAAHRYRVYWEALRLCGLTRSRRRIVAMYLDGSQHHAPQPVTLHLTTLDKGQMIQPWQGQGALLDDGHGRLEPYLLTAARRERCKMKVVDGLDLLPLPGFDAIAVASAPASPNRAVPESIRTDVERDQMKIVATKPS
jgi:nucleoside-diphosphate-sugar epimerase